MRSNAMAQGPQVSVRETGGVAHVALSGEARVAGAEALRRDLDAGAGTAREVEIDLAGLRALDTAGAWAIVDLERRVTEAGGAVRIGGASEAQMSLIAAVRDNLRPPEEEGPGAPGLLDRLEATGRGVWDLARGVASAMSFLGAVVAGLGRLVLHPGRLRLTSLIHHMETTGLHAIPIVFVMSFLIGVVLAYQGAVQLRQFGAEVFVVELIAISILRELGILLTAIIVAGRTGAAFTAAIGSMKMREEVDALRTLGLDPIEVLVVPRVLALVLVLPVLGVISNLSGILGGALMSWIELGVSPGLFRTRLATEVGVWNYGVGMIKAPFFALIIAVVGCYQGMQVRGDAESLGRLTSKAVVVAIFTVIVVDALFSVFFSILEV